VPGVFIISVNGHSLLPRGIRTAKSSFQRDYCVYKDNCLTLSLLAHVCAHPRRLAGGTRVAWLNAI